MPNEVVGVDPGYRNYAIAKLSFSELRYNREGTTEMPIFMPLHMEVWDLQNSRCIRNSRADGGPCEMYRIPHSLTQPTTITQWLPSLNHFFLRSTWLRESFKLKEDGPPLLATVTVENQCGHIKNGKFDFFKIGNATETSIHMADLCHLGLEYKKLLTRIIGKSAKKYGVPNDHARKKNDDTRFYPGRKDTAVMVVRTLFKDLGLVGWIAFLDSVEAMGQKVDDMCDALLLALQVAVNQYEEQQKNERKARREPIEDEEERLDYSNIDSSTYPKLLSSIRYDANGEPVCEFIIDDSSSEEEESLKKKPKKPRKAATPKRKAEPKEKKEPTKRAKATPKVKESVVTKKRKSEAKEKKTPTKRAKKSD